MNCDVVIIGAGVMGCAVAWRLQQRGLHTVVVERGVPGAEASSAAAGILSPQCEADGPGPFLELALGSRALYPGWIEELAASTGIDVGYRREGTLSLGGVGLPAAGDAEEHAGVRDEIAGLRRRLEWQRAAGLRVSWLEGSEVHAREPNLAPCLGALYFPDDHQLEAPLLARSLSLAASQAGARFVTGHVHRVLQEGGQARGVAIGDGDGERVLAPHVVVAAGSWSALVPGGMVPSRGVRPMRGQMVELDSRPPALRHVVFGHLLRDPGGGRRGSRETIGGYLVPRRDGRIVVGSTMELVGFRKEVTVSGLSRLLLVAQGLAPPLGQAEVRRTWAGFRPYTEDALPILGPTSIAGLHLCTGHHRNGILLTPISAEAICFCVTGTWSAGVAPVDLGPFSITRLAEPALPQALL